MDWPSLMAGLAAGASAAFSFAKLWKLVFRKSQPAAVITNGEREYLLERAREQERHFHAYRQERAQDFGEIRRLLSDLSQRVTTLEGR
jgi:hypothetical protein